MEIMKRKTEKVKDWIVQNREAAEGLVIIGVTALVSYKIGYKLGCKDTKKDLNSGLALIARSDPDFEKCFIEAARICLAKNKEWLIF